ncbi:MAG: acyl-CoA dehydrogenase family protein, partial [Leucobacter sp.]
MASDRISSLLPSDLLERLRARAPEYDAENRFFSEDLADLQASGYLAAVVPESMGGSGLSLEELIVAQRILAKHAPATALGVNMHLVWVQVARFLYDRGMGGDSDGSLDWVLRDALAGEIFAFGISEAGNEAVLMDAFSTASPDSDGYLVSGAKVFTTLSPVWTRLGVHARCEPDGEEPYLVFGFVRRDAFEGGVPRTAAQASLGLSEGTITQPGVWNTLGMRATQSWATKLDGVRITTADVAARVEPLVGRHPLILGIFSAFSLLTAAVYAGVADRALELADEAV